MGRKRGSKSYNSNNQNVKNSSKTNSFKTSNSKSGSSMKTSAKYNGSESLLEKLSPIDMISWGFIVYMMSIYLFYMNNLYFDITYTRAVVFWAGAIIFIVLQIGSYIYDIYIEMKDPIKTGLKKKVFIKDDKLFRLPELWMGIFVIANVVAYFNASIKTAAWDGKLRKVFRT